MIIDKHRYIKQYPIKKTDKYLILGTIHPHYEKESFETDFFYGNTNAFWKIVSEACVNSLGSLDEILAFLNENHIAVSDMIWECSRCDTTITRDADIKPLKFNTAIKEEILASDIHTIFFTSAFGENNAAKLFFREFCLKQPKTWNEERMFTIDFFKKEIQCVILYSPSGEANRGIAKSKFYIDAQKKNTKLNVAQYRIDSYREKFCKVISQS